MDAEFLIALDYAQARLGDLYTLAARYRRLRDAAERELLPATTTLGIRMRHARRHDEFSQERIAAVAAELQALQADWEERLATERQSPLGCAVRAAYENDDQHALRQLLPQYFAGLNAEDRPPWLYLGVRVSAPRRGPGSPPFLDAATCAARVAERAREGFRPAAADDGEIASLNVADDPSALDSPVSLAVAADDGRLGVFRREDDGQLVVFTPLLRARFVPALCRSVDDAWWLTNDEPYPEFRNRLAAALRARGFDVLDVGEGEG